MRTLRIYEPKDIDLKEDDRVTRFLMVTILAILMTPPTQDSDPEEYIKSQIANALNAATRMGVSISVTEVVPEVFTR